MTALEAAEMLMEKRGFVTVGIERQGLVYEVGHEFSNFANRYLDGSRLVVTGRGSRYDWNVQLKLVPGAAVVDRERNARGGHYYRCKLEKS